MVPVSDDLLAVSREVINKNHERVALPENINNLVTVPGCTEDRHDLARRHGDRFSVATDELESDNFKS